MSVWAYIEAGLRVLSLHKIMTDGSCECGTDCKTIGKHPRIDNWQLSPHWSDEQLDAMDKAGHFETGFGFILDDHLIIDIDPRNGGNDSYKKLCSDTGIDFEKLASTTVDTGGGGKHIYFNRPTGLALSTKLKDYPGVDFKSSGFVVGAGSFHASGAIYEFDKCDLDALTDAPEKLLDLLRKKDTHRTVLDGRHLDVSESEIVELLQYIPSDCDYETWVQVGMSIHHTTSGAGFAIWDQWSSTGKKYPGTHKLDRHWHSFGKNPNPIQFGTLFHFAKEGGYIPPARGGCFVELVVEKPAVTLDVSHVDLLRPPGFVGDVAKYINGACLFPRERLAVASALHAVGVIGGLRYTDDVDEISTNLMMLCVSGSGCHAKGHPIIMSDGSVKAVERIVPGDMLMGPDSKPRVVRALARGNEEMVKITPVKGVPFVVNINHILHLRRTGGNDRINITVRDWMSKNDNFKSKWKLVRTGIDFCKKELVIPPYSIGALLGDGTLIGKVQLTGMDVEIHNKFMDEISSTFIGIKFKKIMNKYPNKSWHTVLSYGRTGRKYKKNEVPHHKALDGLGLLGAASHEKFIPLDYLTSSREQRLELLAGLIDTDGSNNGCGGYDYVTKSKQLSDDILYLCRSLGLAAYSTVCHKKSQNNTGGHYYRLSISGDCSIVPVLLKRKQVQKRKQIKSVLVTGFSCEVIGVDDYYGFSISGDHLYLDGSFTIHHNTGKEAVQQAYIEIMSAVGIQRCLHGAIKSEQEMIRNLMRDQISNYLIDEYGYQLQKIENSRKRGGASYLEGVNAFQMSAFSKAHGKLLISGDLKDETRDRLIKELAQLQNKIDQNEDKSGALQSRADFLEQRAIPSIDSGIDRPFFSLLGFTTPVSFDELVTVEQATNGFISRCILIREPETNPKRKRGHKPNKVVPDATKYTLRHLFNPAIESGPVVRIEYYDDKKRIPTEIDAVELLEQVSEWVETEAEKQKGRTGLEAIVRRGYEIVAKVSTILSIPGRLRTTEHVLWAFAYMREDLRQKLALAHANELEQSKQVDDRANALRERVLSVIAGEDGETFSVMKQRICRGGKYAPSDLKEIVKEMVDKKIIEKFDYTWNGRKSERFRIL